jgi:hypothetical protein
MNRYYNSTWGRFLTADPYGPSANPGNPLSWNHYAYVANDPVNRNDPSGLCSPDDPYCLVIDVIGSYYGANIGISGAGGSGISRGYSATNIKEYDDEKGTGRSSDAFIAKQTLNSFIAGLTGKTFSTNCKNDLLAVGSSIGEVVGYLQDAMRNRKIVNGTDSYAKVRNPTYDWLPVVPPWAPFLIPVKQVFNRARDVRMMTYAGVIYYRPEEVANVYSGPELGGLLFHEALHGILNLKDGDIQAKLNPEQGAGSSNISAKLAKDCF